MRGTDLRLGLLVTTTVYTDSAGFFIRNMYIRNMRLKSGKIKTHLRNTGGLIFKHKLEKSVVARNFFIKVETTYKRHPSLKCFNYRFYFSSHACLVA